MKTRNFEKEAKLAQDRYCHAAKNTLSDIKRSDEAFFTTINLTRTAKKIRQTNDLSHRKELIRAFDRAQDRLDSLIGPVERFIQERPSLAAYCRNAHAKEIGGNHADDYQEKTRQKEGFGS